MNGLSLSRNLWGRGFDSPLILAGGTAGFGRELGLMNCWDKVAAVVSKSVTLKPREGNPPPRIQETESAAELHRSGQSWCLLCCPA
jgi:dihydroorotate dehydrogenase (NAD+) catalytic subunit